MIAKADARKAAESHHEAQAKALEERIDKAILGWPGAGAVYVEVDVLPRIVTDAIARKYEAGGWKVRRHDDQRDGSSLVLE